VTRPEQPLWLRTPAPAQTPRPAPLSPSAAFEEESGHAVSPAATAKERRKALQRGRIVHRLMQSLPDIPLQRRQDAAERYLKSAAADFAAAEAAAIARQVLGILADHEFAQIFAPGSRAEVPIVGRIARSGADPIAVAGQVDRLAVAEHAVLIADYKTDAVAASRIEQVPRPYIAQLALYRAILARLYPAKTVRAALLFTSVPVIIELPGATMDAALAEIIEAHAAVKVS
jgi:ATP-dependent helicase/nuclease subunit A